MKNFDEEKARNDYKNKMVAPIKKKDTFHINLSLFNFWSYNLIEWNEKISWFFNLIQDSINNSINKNKMNKDNVLIFTNLHVNYDDSGSIPVNPYIEIEVREQISEDEYVNKMRLQYEEKVLARKKQIQEKKDSDYALYIELKKRFEK